MKKSRIAITLSMLFVALSLQAGRTRRKSEQLSPQEERRLLTQLARMEKKGHLPEKDAARLQFLRTSMEKNKAHIPPQQTNFGLPPQD